MNKNAEKMDGRKGCGHDVLWTIYACPQDLDNSSSCPHAHSPSSLFIFNIFTGEDIIAERLKRTFDLAHDSVTPTIDRSLDCDYAA